MDQLKNYYKEMGVDEKVFDYAQEVEKGLKDRFEKLDAIAQLNQIDRKSTRLNSSHRN